MTNRHCLLSGCVATILSLSAGAGAQAAAETVPTPDPPAVTAAPASAPSAPGNADSAAAPLAAVPETTPVAAQQPAPTAPSLPVATSDTMSAPAARPARLTAPRLGWDINVEGAFGRYFPAHDSFGFGRIRGGLLYSADPIFYSLGVTYEWSNLENATFGIQAEAMHIESGLWAQLGALVDTQVHPGAMLALGWSVLGAELQYRKFDPSDWGFAAVGKIRIPVTFIARAFQ